MGLLWNLDRRAEVGHHLVRVETAHIVAWRRPLAHHDLGNRFVAIDGADIDIVIEWIAPERIPEAPPPSAVEPPRRPPETVRAEIGREPVRTPVTNAHPLTRSPLEKKERERT